MNRSFRAQESQMQGALKQRQQQFGGLRGSSAAKEKDEELALFLEMKKREKERNDLLLHTSEEFDSALGSNSNLSTSPIFNISSSTPAPMRKTGADDFLNSENDKNDYDCNSLCNPFSIDESVFLCISKELESRDYVE
ncbi:hypothetical protein PIB30_004954 [Stylosanthes scabra]|uniref:Uncharacterized protein n=1 Tax=Stylosanthes scabra TaxID=79078 RepID=A0ABU6X3U4_9FABA|nr:hypothetical protein [Stylosanthes scabra]